MSRQRDLPGVLAAAAAFEVAKSLEPNAQTVLRKFYAQRKRNTLTNWPRNALCP